MICYYITALLHEHDSISLLAEYIFDLTKTNDNSETVYTVCEHPICTSMWCTPVTTIDSFSNNLFCIHNFSL